MHSIVTLISLFISRAPKLFFVFFIAFLLSQSWIHLAHCHNEGGTPPQPEGAPLALPSPLPSFIPIHFSITCPSTTESCLHFTPEQFKENIAFCCNHTWCKATPERACGLLKTGIVATGAGLLIWHFGPNVFNQILNSPFAFIFTSGSGTLLSALALFNSTPTHVPKTPPDQLHQLAVAIPIDENTRDVRPTLESLKKAGIAPNQIYIIENTSNRYSRSESKTLKTLSENEVYSQIHYRSTRKGESKVTAEYLSAVLAKEQGFKYLMTLEDNAVIPPGFDPYLSLLTGNVTMIAYPVKPSNNNNYLTQNQQIEYRRTDRHNYFKNKLGTVFAPHSAVSVTVLDSYLENMLRRPVDGALFAEEQKKGAAWRWTGNPIAMAPGPEVQIEVPDNCQTFWSQRVQSWDTGRHLSTGIFLQDFITDCPQRIEMDSILQTSFRKVYQFQALYQNISETVAPVLMISLWNQPFFWMVVGGIWEANNLIDIADATYFEPSRQGRPVCQPSELLCSCLVTHSSIFFNLLRILQGTAGALCANLGAGAASGTEYSLKQGYPAELLEIFHEKNPTRRLERLLEFTETVSIDRIYTPPDSDLGAPLPVISAPIQQEMGIAPAPDRETAQKGTQAEPTLGSAKN